VSASGIGNADTSPARWLIPEEPTSPGEPTSLQEAVGVNAMAGMLVAKEAAISPEVVDAVCAAPAWETFCSHIYLGDRDSLSDEEVLYAQYVARTLVERVGDVYPGDEYTPSHIALMVFYRGVLEGHCKTQGDLN
jgi:hypothetical protein